MKKALASVVVFLFVGVLAASTMALVSGSQDNTYLYQLADSHYFITY